jgi:hypothetical protein
MKPVKIGLVAGLLVAAGAASSHAGDNEFDVSFGVGVANNYISRGSTQSADKPIIDGYMEATYGIVYAGVWASGSILLPTTSKSTFMAVSARVRQTVAGSRLRPLHL